MLDLTNTLDTITAAWSACQMAHLPPSTVSRIGPGHGFLRHRRAQLSRKPGVEHGRQERAETWRSGGLGHGDARPTRWRRLTSSPAFVRKPEGNGVAERAIRTLKEQLLWVRHFATVEELRLALAGFAALHNASWLRERQGTERPIRCGPSRRLMKPKPPRSSDRRHDPRNALFQNRARYTRPGTS